jgi:hypothetical protein
MEQINEGITFKAEVEFIISPQALRILSQSKFSIVQFINWAVTESSTMKSSLGGNHVSIFLEQMHLKEAEEARILQAADDAIKMKEEMEAKKGGG